MSRRTALLFVSALMLAACADRACGGRGGLPPGAMPTVKRGDGRDYRMLDRGAWKGFYQLFTKPFYWEKTEHGLDAGGEH